MFSAFMVLYTAALNILKLETIRNYKKN